MKSTLIGLMLFLAQQLLFSQCQDYLDFMVLDKEVAEKMIRSHKLLPKEVKEVFEKEIIKSKVDFTDYSSIHKYNFKTKKTPLIFLFCLVSSENEVILATYNREGLASHGGYYFFTFDHNSKIKESCLIRKVEMICDWKRLKSIVEKREYDF